MNFRNIFALITILMAGISCRQKEARMNNSAIPEGYNHLYHSTSPYLKQHATNPVEWYPWGREALDKAAAEDKPILVSIGYSSCHWCHVMERECFVNDSIAALMNAHFICIKVDREERPDIDQIYMEAVQTMGQQGGWPLNVFLTPDAKPFYGGTYFPPDQWKQLLQSVSQAYRTRKKEISDTAGQLAEALATSDLLRLRLKAGTPDFEVEKLRTSYRQISSRFDTLRGGLARAPKFPMPSIWNFLLDYQEHFDHEGLDQINRTLHAMARGGLYDQIGGGFARYSTDANWLVPHFEKMLYDNAQLISLYSKAYRTTADPLYRQVVRETVDWAQHEMMNEEGGFYSALDADSEGEEGKYYIWTADEFSRVLQENASLMGDYYNVSDSGNWEGLNILHRSESDETFAQRHRLGSREFDDIKKNARQRLLEVREHRERPGLDDKTLTAWNGLMLRGLADAYAAFGEEHYLELARKNAAYILTTLGDDGHLWRSRPDKNTRIPGFLDDYAFTIDGLLQLYQVSGEEQWLRAAHRLTQTTLDEFYDDTEDMFYYSSKKELIANKKELFDNVIPSSNSQMGINLHVLGLMLDEGAYIEKSEAMLARFAPMLDEYARDASNWAAFYLYLATPTAEIAVTGKDMGKTVQQLAALPLSNKILQGTTGGSALPLLKDKPVSDQITIYVCYNKTCKLPVHTISEALEQIK